MKRYDAIVIGGGHNGLVTAAYLARAKKSVLVLERRPRVGGAAVTEEIFPGLGAERLHALVKLMTMSSADFLDEWFETDVLKATKSASGIIGTFLGPWSPGTAYVLLHHYMGELDGVFRAWGFAKGGTGAVSEAIASAARSFGAEIRCDAGVSKVMLKNGRAVGGALESGDELHASTLVSSLQPRRTFLQLLESDSLPDEF